MERSRRDGSGAVLRRGAWVGAVVAVMTAGIPSAGAAQSLRSGGGELPPLLPEAYEVALARSAAPATVSDDATVLVLERGVGYVPAVQGTNGVTCIVDRSWPRALEPICYDREGSETILEIRIRAAELRERGWTQAEVDADRGEGIRSGRLRLPRRPALSWMMSAEQYLYDSDGSHAGEWKPHLMLYYPGMTADELGLGGGVSAHGPYLVDGGEATSVLIFLMPEFVPGPDRPTGAPEPGSD